MTVLASRKLRNTKKDKFILNFDASNYDTNVNFRKILYCSSPLMTILIISSRNTEYCNFPQFSRNGETLVTKLMEKNCNFE